MARYKPVDSHLSKLLPVKFSEQILPGTFEYALNWLVDHEMDLSVFDGRYRNDEVGASAYHPAVLLKVVLLGYARGLTSSRDIERACRENVVFMALSGDTQPHFTTIASFVAKLPAEITSVFRDVLLICDEQGLIGKAQLHARAKGNHVAGKIVVALLATISIGDDIRTKQLSDQRAQGLGRGIFDPRCANGIQ